MMAIHFFVILKIHGSGTTTKSTISSTKRAILTSTRSQTSITNRHEIEPEDPRHPYPTTTSEYRGIEGSKLIIVPKILDNKKKWKHVGYCEVRFESIELHYSVPTHEEDPDILR